jgi:hypothetical protein
MVKAKKKFEQMVCASHLAGHLLNRYTDHGHLLKAIELKQVNVLCAVYVISDAAEDVNSTWQNGLVGDAHLVHAITKQLGQGLPAHLMHLVHAI